MKFSQIPYEKVDKEQVAQAYESFTKRLIEAKSGEEAFAVHSEQYAYSDHIMNNITLAQVRFTIDTSDEFYSGENDYYDELLPELEAITNKYLKALYDSPYREYLEGKIGSVAFKNLELKFKAFDEKIVPLIQEENALSTQYDKLISEAKIEFDGQTCNLSMLTKYCTSPDREVRKAAWKAKNDWFLAVTDEIDEIYDKLVKNRTAQAKAMGYSDFTELGYYRMNRNSYSKEDIETFRKEVKECFVPYVSSLHERRRQRLGLDKLKVWDNMVYFSDGNPNLIVSEEEMMEKAREMYHSLSPETSEFIDAMIDGEMFDIFTKPHKSQGGYMTYFPEQKLPFIFGNCNGTFDDVGLVTHECGHAFQGYVTRNNEIRETLDLTMETAEIHSTAMEYFTHRFMEMFFGDRADDYRTLHNEDSMIFIPYGCLVDEFQHRVYENPDLTPAERKALWRKLEKEYRPLLDFEDLDFYENGGWWQNQSHIFDIPFYYIDYVIAGICAVQYGIKAEENFDEAWSSYLKLCKLSASKFFPETMADVGLENPFIPGSVRDIVSKLH